MNDTRPKKKIVLIYLYPYIDSIPSLCNTVRLLAHYGYDIDIITTSDDSYVMPVFQEKNINIFNIYLDYIREKFIHCQKNLNLKNKWIKRFFSLIRIGAYQINRIINKIKIITIPLSLKLRQNQKNYCCIIGVDPEGLVIAGQCARFIKVPFIYYSLELLLSYEVVSSSDHILKKKELEFSKCCSFIIIQDKERAQLMSKDNEIPLNHFVFVPNSPLGSAKREKKNYWHTRFNISPETRIILHSGSIGPWTGIDQIINSVEFWPKNWILIIHTRYSPEQNEEILKLQNNINPDRVLFSLNPVSWQEYSELVDSADIGIAFYIDIPGSTNTQENIRSIGLSSGKIAYYLKSGLPIITNKKSSISDLIINSKCGIPVNSSEEIRYAIESISEDYDGYSRSAISFFDSNLNFENNFFSVIQRIEKFDNLSDNT